MAEGRYYWLKLKRDFFKRHDIVIIESMPNGKDYILFYLKLLCESVDNDGSLRFSDKIPYNEDMLATITRTNVDIVRNAINLFSELGMMEILDDGTFYMSEVERLIGSESSSTNAIRQKRFRENRKSELSVTHTVADDVTENNASVTENNASVTNSNANRYANVTENNESKSKSKSKSIDIEREKEKEKAPSGRGGLTQTINSVSSPPLREALTEYARMREKMKAPLTDYAMKLVIDQVEQMTEDEATRVAIINQSIKNGWKDLFPLETKSKKKTAVGSFGNYDQRNFDYRDAEKKLRGYDKKEDDEDAIH